MSREIKFRAWDKPGKLMVYSGQKDTHDLDGNDRSYWTYLAPGIKNAEVFEVTVLDNGEVELERITGELMQYTGLKDKNGVEIYEGDIVRIASDAYGTETIHQIEYGIDYDYPAFELKPQDFTDANGLSWAVCDGDYTIEVIGNIYEAPELLNSDQVDANTKPNGKQAP